MNPELNSEMEQYSNWKAPETPEYADGDDAVAALKKMGESGVYAGKTPEEIAALPDSARILREAYPQLNMWRRHYSTPGAGLASSDRLPSARPSVDQKFFSGEQALQALHELADQAGVSIEEAARTLEFGGQQSEKIEEAEALADPEREAKRASLERWYRNPNSLSAEELLEEIRQDGTFIAHFTGAGQRVLESGEVMSAARVAEVAGESFSRGGNLGFKSAEPNSIYFSLNRTSNMEHRDTRVSVAAQVLDPTMKGRGMIENQTMVLIAHPAILATRNQLGINMRERAGAAESIVEVRGGLKSENEPAQGLEIGEFIALVPGNVLVDPDGIPVYDKDGRANTSHKLVSVDRVLTAEEKSAYAARGEQPVMLSKDFWEATVARLELEEGKSIPKTLIFTEAEDHEGMIEEFQKKQGIPSRTNFSSLEGKLALVEKTARGDSRQQFVSYPQPNRFEKAHVHMDVTRQSLDYIQGNPEHTPQDILEFVARDRGLQVDKLLEALSGNWEGYSIGTHTKMVMEQYKKYFSEQPLPAGMKPELMELTLALHDIGKSRNLARQHEETAKVMIPFLRKMKFSDQEVTLAATLVGGDPIGKCLVTGAVDESAQYIRDAAQKVGVAPAEFLELQRIYFMSDAGSYTEDAGGKKSLDNIFVFDPENKKVSFAPGPAAKFEELRQLVIS